MSEYEGWSLFWQFCIFAAGVITVIVYYRQLKAMQSQLQTSLETSARMAHIDLLSLAISDPDIGKVWESEVKDANPTALKQHLFVNLHLSHMQTLYELNRMSECQVEADTKHFFQNNYYQKFWENAREHREKSLVNAGPKAKRFYELCEAAYSSHMPGPDAEPG